MLVRTHKEYQSSTLECEWWECALDWMVRKLRMTRRWQIEILHIEGEVEEDEGR